MNLNPTVVGAGIAAVAATFTTALTYRNSKRTTDLAARTVSQQEYDGQQARYSRLLDDQQKLLDRMQAQVDRLADQLAKEQGSSEALRAEVRELQRQLVEVQTQHVKLLQEIGRDPVASRKPTRSGH